MHQENVRILRTCPTRFLRDTQSSPPPVRSASKHPNTLGRAPQDEMFFRGSQKPCELVLKKGILHTIHVNGWRMFIVPLWWSWHALPLWCCEGTLKSWCCKELWASRHLPKLSEPDVSKVLVNREEKRTQRNQLNGGVKRLPSQVLREKLPGLTATRCHPRQQQRCYVCVDTPLIHLKVVSIHFNQLWLINTYSHTYHMTHEYTWHIRSYFIIWQYWLLCNCKHPSPPEPSSAAAVVSPWRHDLISFPILPRCTSCASLFSPFFGAPELCMADFLAGPLFGWCDLVTPSAGCSALTPLFLVRPQRKFTVACNNEEGPMITAESDFDFQHVLLGQDISTKAACISWVQTSQKNLWFPLSRRKSGNQELSKGNKLFKSQHTQNKVEVVVVWTNTREY